MALHSDAELSRVPPGKLYPKPEPELAAPAVHAPESQPELDSPNNLAAEQQPDIDAPASRAPQAQPDLSAPANRAPITPSEISAPVNLNAIADPELSSPNVLTPIAVPGIQPHHGRIGYVNLLFGSGVATSVNDGDATKDALLTPSTWERWRAGVGLKSYTVTMPSVVNINYFGIAGFSIPAGSEVSIQWSPDLVTDFTNLVTVTVVDGIDSIMRQFSSVGARRYRLRVNTGPSGVVSGFFDIGVFYCGPVLELERPTRGGVTPATLNRQTSYSNEFSAAGQILGRVINRQGIKTSVSLKNLTDAWYRASFDPFVQAARTRPFFYLWNPRDYPLDCIYGVCSDDIKPTLQGGREMMDVSFDIEGL